MLHTLASPAKRHVSRGASISTKQQWVLKDNYLFFSRFFHRHSTISRASIKKRTDLPVSILQSKCEQRRYFRDYFTTEVPGGSQHPEGYAPKHGGARGTSTIRIPLKSAKHHFGAITSRGSRRSNEDCYQAGTIDVDKFSKPLSEKAAKELTQVVPGEKDHVFYFGVFDGHGGDKCSSFLKDWLHDYIERSARTFKEAEPGKSDDDPVMASDKVDTLKQGLIDEWRDTVGGYFKRFKPRFGQTDPVGEVSADGCIEASLVYSFLRADLDFISQKGPAYPADEQAKEPFPGGSTASVALISTPTHVPFWNPRTPATLVTAHVGDTRIILCNTETGQGEPLTHNHHPSSPTESGRLRRYATAFVSDSFGEERFGGFANTRAFGGTPQKRMGISAEPDILTKVLAPSQFSFLVLCTDGVSGVLSDQEIVDIVKECRTPEEGAKALVAFAEDVGGLSGDNATAIVIRLGGWTRRIIGGGGSAGTKEHRKWKKEHGSAEAGNRPQ